MSRTKWIVKVLKIQFWTDSCTFESWSRHFARLQTLVIIYEKLKVFFTTGRASHIFPLMQQKHIENDQYSSEVQTNDIPYFTARTVCTGPLREMRAIVIFLFWQKYRADHKMNRLLFDDDSNKAVLKMWNFCHWMEKLQILSLGSGEVRFQLNRALGG